MEKSYINQDEESSWFGHHYLLDMWGITPIHQLPFEVEYFLKKAAIEAGATILHSYIHDFGNGGVSGMVVLQESHISIHTWPERAFAAIDVYLCGDCNPLLAIDYLIKVFHPDRYEYVDVKRGMSTQQ